MHVYSPYADSRSTQTSRNVSTNGRTLSKELAVRSRSIETNRADPVGENRSDGIRLLQAASAHARQAALDESLLPERFEEPVRSSTRGRVCVGRSRGLGTP